jgi:hypothetical protein
LAGFITGLMKHSWMLVKPVSIVRRCL